MAEEQLKSYENDWNEGVKTLERELKALHGDDFVMLDLKFQIKFPKERHDYMGNRVSSYDVRVIVGSEDMGPFAVFQETEYRYGFEADASVDFVRLSHEKIETKGKSNQSFRIQCGKRLYQLYWEFYNRCHDPPVKSDKQLYKVDCGWTYKKPDEGPKQEASCHNSPVKNWIPQKGELVEGKFGWFVAGTMKSGVDQDCFDSDDEPVEEKVEPDDKQDVKPRAVGLKLTKHRKSPLRDFEKKASRFVKGCSVDEDSDDEGEEEEVKPCIKKAKQPPCRYSIPTSIAAAESWLEVTAKFGPSGH